MKLNSRKGWPYYEGITGVNPTYAQTLIIQGLLGNPVLETGQDDLARESGPELSDNKIQLKVQGLEFRVQGLEFRV